MNGRAAADARQTAFAEPFENTLTFLLANHVISAASITILAASVTAMQLVAG
jgi:hypothetical protein